MRVQGLLLAFTMLVSSSAEAAPAVQVAVMDLQARNAESLIAESASEALVGALRELQVFKVISRSEIGQMLSIDRERALLSGGCSESSCLAEIGSALGARYLVTGSVTGIDKTKGPFALRVQLFDMRKAEVVSDESRPDLKSAREVLENARALGMAVVRPILEKEQGFLEVSCREEGAKVSVDGRLVGLTPLPVQKLGWGPHRIVVEKEGFIAWARDIQIERNQVSAESITLIPSPDFVESYRSRNRGMRVGAWVTTALAVAGAGAAAYLQLGPVSDRYDKFKPLQQAFSGGSASDIRAACETAADGLSGEQAENVRNGPNTACYSYAQDLSSEGTNYLWAARGAAGMSVIAAAAAVYFWASGEDPSRYDLFIESQPVDPAPSAAIVPIPGGLAASLSFEL